MNLKKFLGKDYFLFGIIILGIFIRIILLTLPSFKIDMTDWQAWASRLVEVSPIHFYATNYFSDYFPGYLYMLWFIGKSFTIFFPHTSIFSLGFEFYLKFFTNLFDLATAYYIYKIISNYKKSLSLLSAALYLANPALIFNSSVWGQVDGILTFFMVYSCYCLVELKRTYRFSIASTLSTLVKPQGLAIFPITLIYLLTNFKYKKYFGLLFIPTLLIIFSLPFFLKDPILGLFHLFQNSTNTYPYTSMFSYNFWSFAGWWIPDTTKLFGVSYQILGIILYFISLLLITLPLFKNKTYNNNLLFYFACALASFAFFLFLTRIHQRYLFPFFAFLLISTFIMNSLKLKVLYLILSLIHFINLLFVYYYYNFVYSNPKFSSFLIYRLLSESYNLFTTVNLLGFGVLLLIYYKLNHSLKIDAKNSSQT